MGEIFTRFLSMPSSVKGFVSKDADGNYNIYINANLSDEEQKEAYAHELLHITNRDFENDKNSVLEKESNVYAQLLQNIK